MPNQLQASPVSLIFAFLLVAVAMGISYREKLKLEKEIIIAVTRMVIQLVAVAYVLGYIFKVNNFWLTSLMVLIIVINASFNAAGRGKGLQHPPPGLLCGLGFDNGLNLRDSRPIW